MYLSRLRVPEHLQNTSNQIRERFLGYRQAPRSLNAYATHIPALIALARLREVSRVLEFGCGSYSTLLFLDPVAFPQLEKLDSYENDVDWLASIRSRTEGSRVNLNYVDNHMFTVLPELDLHEYDLIFVDDSISASLRQRTILELARKRRDVMGVVVIHDFEQAIYREASSAFRHRKRLRALNPEVGVLWERSWRGSKKLNKLDQIVYQHRRAIPPDDVASWTSIIENTLL